MLKIDNTFLVVIDMQGSLARAMHNSESVVDGCRRLVQGAQCLGIPIVWTEQIPEKLGGTLPQITELLAGTDAIPKRTFSCAGEPSFTETIDGLQRKQALITGIESHVCVYQTAIDLLQRGYQVEVAADTVSSRTPENRQLGLDRIAAAGGTLTSVEMALFELMRTAEHPAFRDVLKIVK